jgi:hypothetical protein
VKEDPGHPTNMQKGIAAMGSTRSLISFLFGGRGHLASKKRMATGRVARSRSFLHVETLESRCTPTAFTVLDSFSGSVASGGTYLGLLANAASPTVTGTDTTLHTGTAAGFAGSADPNQFADSRSVTLGWGGGTLNPASEVSAGVANGFFGFGGTGDAASTVIIDYTNLSATSPEVLLNKTIAVHYSALAPLGVDMQLNINGIVVGSATVVVGINAEQDFDASAFVGQQINSVTVQLSNGTLGFIMSFGVGIDEIDASFGSPPASNPPGVWKNQPQLWPVDSLTIGGIAYNKTQLITVLSTPTMGDAVLILADQLIAAELSILNASAHSTATDAIISDADSALAGINLLSHANKVKPNTPLGAEMIADASYLDHYNNG